MWVLDTNIISEFSRGDRANPNVITWFNAQRITELYITSVTVQEIELGILRLTGKDEVKQAALRRWFDTSVLGVFGSRILPFDSQAALIAAGLQYPASRPQADTMIASCALSRGLGIATRNVADFDIPGLVTINPFD